MQTAPRQLRSQKPIRRSRHRRAVVKRRRLSRRTQLVVAGAAAVIAVVFWAVIARAVAPAGNTTLNRYDAIIVLGSPADSEGNPKPEQLARVTEGVREYERGVASRLILTGGPVRNQYVEAKVMARVAEAQGVPRSALVEEPRATDTIENACYAARIAKEHGWSSAEVVGGALQLPRAGLIFSRLPLQWRIHAAPPLEPESSIFTQGAEALEILKTVRYLLYARWADRCVL